MVILCHKELRNLLQFTYLNPTLPNLLTHLKRQWLFTHTGGCKGNYTKKEKDDKILRDVNNNEENNERTTIPMISFLTNPQISTR